MDDSLAQVPPPPSSQAPETNLPPVPTDPLDQPFAPVTPITPITPVTPQVPPLVDTLVPEVPVTTPQIPPTYAPTDMPPPPVVPPVEPPPVPAAPIEVVQKTKKKFSLFPILLVLIILGILGVGGYFAMGLIKKSQSVELSYWGLWEPESVMRPLIDEYQATHPNVKITYEMQSIREYRERLQSAISQGRGPDIFRIHNSWIPMFRSDLSPIPATVYSSSEYSTIFYPSASQPTIPLMYDGLVMYVNDSLLSQASLPVPTSWDELRSTAITLTRCETESQVCKPGDRVLIAGASLGLTDNVDHWQDILATLLLQNNVNLNSPSGRAAQDAIDYYASFSKSLGIWEATLSPSTILFQSGKLAIYFGPSWRYHEIRQANPDLAFSMHAVPQLPLDPERNEQPVTWASFWTEGVNAKSKNTAAAWEFLKFLSSKESLQKLYKEQVALGRDFGEPYPRTDMRDQADSDSLGVILDQAGNSRTWYLASYTFDGPTGINSRLSQAFADVVSSKAGLSGLPGQINAILGQYGLSPQAPASQ